MTVAIAATLLTAADPAPVQIVLSGLTTGDTYTVEGVYGSWRWPVPGGIGTSSDGSNVVLIDNRSPLNGAITYEANVSGTAYTSSAVTVTYGGYHILQSLSGEHVANCLRLGFEDERSLGMRTTAFDISGRRDPVSRYDVSGSDAYTLELHAEGEASTTILSLLRTGKPVVLRSTVDIVDVPPTEILLVASANHRLVGTQSTLRSYALSVRVVGEPQPFTALVAFDWDDFDTFYSADTWTGFDAAWAGSTWDDLDAADWGAL